MTLKGFTLFVSIILFSFLNIVSAKPGKIQKNIKVDQFGYRPGDLKIAVIADPELGFNSNESFTPGQVYEVRKWNDDKVVFTGNITEWNKGAIDYTSGDKGWWFDFSEVSDEGDYYIYDQQMKVASNKFRIAKDVYKNLLRTAMRVFYYQRINEPKEKPCAEEPWIDSAAFVGTNQDREALYVKDKKNKSLAKDLSGGWMDAGDFNKYVTFADSPVNMLLTAYEQNPKIFSDDYNIPESGNGIPDIIDEIKYELDWIKKMQMDDGGLLIKMGNIDYNIASPPSSDRRSRYYGPECSSSSIAAAGMFAHAAIVFSKFPALIDYAADLEKRAVKTWEHLALFQRELLPPHGSAGRRPGTGDLSLRRTERGRRAHSHRIGSQANLPRLSPGGRPVDTSSRAHAGYVRADAAASFQLAADQRVPAPGV